MKLLLMCVLLNICSLCAMETPEQKENMRNEQMWDIHQAALQHYRERQADGKGFSRTLDPRQMSEYLFALTENKAISTNPQTLGKTEDSEE